MSAKHTAEKPLSRSLRVYQKIAIVFVALAFVLLLFVLYLSIASATIHVTPVPQVVNTTVSIEVVPDATLTGQVAGTVEQATVTQAKTFYLPEEGATPIEAKAGGAVTLINETGSDQQLIATTRLMSEEGVLFRLDEGVTVPAHGQVDATAHADEPGLTGEIGPTQFTIPGLATSLQDVIYAVSIDAMRGGVSYKRALTQTDLDEAASTLEQEILESMKAQEAQQEVTSGLVYFVEEVERVAGEVPGAEIGSFTVSLTSNITTVHYDAPALMDLVRSDLESRISDNYLLSSVSEDGPQVEVKSIDAQAGKATLGVYLDGTAVIAPSSDVLDPERLVGRSASEVMTILESSELIDRVSVAFTPFWLKRIPTLEDHIQIIVDEPVTP